MALLNDLPFALDYDLDSDAPLLFDELIAELDAKHEADREAEVIALVRRWHENQAEIDVLDARIRELQARKARRGENCDWLKGQMLRIMTALATKKIKTAEYTVSITTRQPALIVTDAENLPLEFQRMTVVPDKSALNAHFKQTGELPAGCDLGEETQSVTIRT